MTTTRPKFCYVLPEYHPSGIQHYQHIPRLLEELSQRVDLALVVERGEVPNSLKGRCRLAKCREGRLGRFLSLLQLLVRLRSAGYRNFFVRISLSAALPIGLFGRLIGIKLFYWNSGQGKALFEPWNGNIAQKLRRIRQEMRMLPLYAALQLAHRVVTGPERMGEYYIRHFGVPRKKILILHNEIDPEAYAASSRGTTSAEARRILGLPENVPLLLFVGRISKLKGSPYLLPVIERVAVKIPHFCAVLVGPNYEPDWPRRLESSPARDVILFVGPVPSSELPTYYCACDVVMLPSNSEGFPRTLLEAMAMSRPIVCFDVGGVVDILPPETHKDLIPLADVEAFSRRLVDLLTNPKECAQRGKQLRAAVNRFSMEAAADTIERKIANGLQCACYEDSADAP